MAVKRSPLAPQRFPALPDIAGLRLVTAACGIKYKARQDLCLMMMDPGSTIAGVLTRSKTASAPVEWCRAQLPRGRARAIVVNSVRAEHLLRDGDRVVGARALDIESGHAFDIHASATMKPR